jgi:hypothetical protein
LPLPAEDPKKIIIHTQAFIAGSHPQQHVKIYINQIFIKEVNLSERIKNTLELPFPRALTSLPIIKLEFQFSDAISPQALGLGIDTRPLAMGIEFIEFE